MKNDYACHGQEHFLARRRMLCATAAGAAGLTLGGTASWIPLGAAEQLKKSPKRILTLWLHGGISQFESWDPKPNTLYGGPFRSIETSVPGIRISELLPYTAKQMHHLALVRGLNTNNPTHDHTHMTTGHSVKGFPTLGAVAAKCLSPERLTLPGSILIRPTAATGGGPPIGNPVYLGARYATVFIDGGKAPTNSSLPASIGAAAESRRQDFRRFVDDRFAGRRRTADTDAYTFTYDQAIDLMARRDVFDISKEPARDQEKYGSSDFGKHCLLARRLLEHGVPFVQVNFGDWDTHAENFEFHIEKTGQFDQPFATLVNDLVERGLFDDTLVIVMSELGRTPKINDFCGRDHWGAAWSVCLGGARIHRGAVVGKTSPDGTEVVDREVDHGMLFHTYLRAVGVNTSDEFDIAGRKYPIADPSKSAIKELLG